MLSVALCDPFQLFPRQVEIVSLEQLPTAAGLNGKVIADRVHVIIKRNTAAGNANDYNDRSLDRRVHVKTADIPDKYALNPDLVLDFIIKTKHGEIFKITGADRADDMDLGRVPFLTWMVSPYGSSTL